MQLDRNHVTACSRLEKATCREFNFTPKVLPACQPHAKEIWKGNFTLRNVSRFDILCGMFWNDVSGSEFFLFPGLFV